MAWILGQLVDLADEDDRRCTPRTKLRLDINVDGMPRGLVRVLDLSCSGMMIHSDFDFVPGERFLVQLPGVGDAEAQVVWKRHTLLGCRFQPPVTRAAIAATLLKAGPPPAPAVNPTV